MKNSIFIIILCLSYQLSNGQSVEWSSDVINVMYIGYKNVLPLKFSDLDEKYLEISTTYGKIVKNDKGKFIWTGDRPSNVEHILLIKYKGKVLGEFKKMFKRMPDPIVQTLPISGTKLKYFTGLKGFLPNGRTDIPIFVQSYIIQINNNGVISNLINKGPMLSKRNKKTLKYVSDNAGISIVSLLVRCPGDLAARTLSDLRIQ